MSLTPRPFEVHQDEDMSLSFVVCLSDEGMLKANLLTSPCLGQARTMRSSRSATPRAPRMGSPWDAQGDA